MSTYALSVKPSEPQLTYVAGLCKRLHLPKHMLDTHCVQTFGKSFKDMTMFDCSVLIDELKEWTVLPADMQRALGQLDLL